MKKLLATLSLAASLAASATPPAQGAFDSSGLNVQPDLTERLVIRLDDGNLVIVTVKDAQRFATGERVRVVSHTYSPYGLRVEHE
jgi:outer membrane lipoprotein SlyB